MDVKIQLMTVSIDLVKQEYNFLVCEDNEVPNLVLISGRFVIDVVRELASAHLDTAVNWLKFQLVDVVFDEKSNTLCIQYCVLIPNTLTVRNSKWVSLGDLRKQEYKNVLELAKKCSSMV